MAIDLSFKYEAFGLKIHSEIVLPELIPSKSIKADLNIYLGKVDLPVDNVQDERFSYKVTDNSIYRFWDEIGKFKITNYSIIIDPVHDVNKTVLRNFLLGTIFATFLRLKGFFVLHASSVNINGSAIAFSGFKGYGKSTTAMAFYNQGYSVISDDYIIIEFDINNVPMVSPGFPSLRLSNESRESMGLDKFDLDDEIDKIYLSTSKSFSTNKIPLKKIYILQRDKKSEIFNLNPQDAFMELVKNTFGINIFSKLELPDNFYQCEKIVKNVEVSILKISDSIQNMHRVVRIIEKDIGDQL